MAWASRGARWQAADVSQVSLERRFLGYGKDAVIALLFSAFAFRYLDDADGFATQYKPGVGGGIVDNQYIDRIAVGRLC